MHNKEHALRVDLPRCQRCENRLARTRCRDDECAIGAGFVTYPFAHRTDLIESFLLHRIRDDAPCWNLALLDGFCHRLAVLRLAPLGILVDPLRSERERVSLLILDCGLELVGDITWFLVSAERVRFELPTMAESVPSWVKT